MSGTNSPVNTAASFIAGPTAPTTQEILDGLNLQRSQIYNNARALPPGAAQRALDAQAVAANTAYVNAVAAAKSNGGVIPGASDGTPGATTTPIAPFSLNTAVSQASAAMLGATPALPPSQSLSAQSTNAVAPVAKQIQASGGSIPATPGNTTPIITVSDQRVRLTPKNMNILGDNSGIADVNAIFGGDAGASVAANSLLVPLIATQGMMFPFTPTIDYIGAANYSTQTAVHSNQDFRFYTNTPSMNLTIAGGFSAQTQEEAVYMLACLHFLRVVTKMRFGASSSPGVPPPVLVLNGYGKGMFNNLPVIVTNFTMSMPPNVDYVHTTSVGIDAWLPVYTTITVTCTVQNTPNKLRTFDWDKFATGALLSDGGWS